jgi:lipoprotein-anchoring transpeptidase ErfK/SrfK
MILGLLLTTLGLFPIGPITAATTTNASDDLAALFASAQKDPAGVVPLLIEGSASMSAMDAKQAQVLGDTLDVYARRAFYGPERLPGMDRLGLVLHTVAKGENPTRIAQKYHIDPDLIARLNKDYDERKLHVGEVLKVLDLSGASAGGSVGATSEGSTSASSGASSGGGLQIVVQKSRYRLSIWRALPGGKGKVLVAHVPVGLGANESPTPVGATKITKRVLKPEWTNPVTKQTYADGDPNNVLGGYWIALDSDGIGKSGIGLHGFTGSAPSNWIEQPASNGCVRMLQADIDRVYHLAIEGTPVVIQQ